MGTDISLYCEKKIDGKWVALESGAWKNPNIYSQFEAHDWQIERNYNLFGLLAGVRGSVFPLSPPKGIPHDLSKLVKNPISKGYLHSVSYYYISELLKIRNDVSDAGYIVDLKGYKEFKSGNLKNINYISYFDYNCPLTSNKDMDKRLSLPAFDDGKKVFTKIATAQINNWEFTDFWETIDLMCKVGGDPENLRIVFGFD